MSTPNDTRPKGCVCDGRYDGCEHKYPCRADVTDDRWGPWCSECNPRRFAHIDKGFADIAAALVPDPGGRAAPPPTTTTTP